jgi:hypothetical protein
MPRTNTCVTRKQEYGANGVLEETESVWIEWIAGNTYVTEKEWLDNTLCTGVETLAKNYTLGDTCGDEKWFTAAYATPDVPTSGAAVGEALFPSSAVALAVINSGLLVVLALFPMFMQKFF